MALKSHNSYLDSDEKLLTKCKDGLILFIKERNTGVVLLIVQ